MAHKLKGDKLAWRFEAAQFDWFLCTEQAIYDHLFPEPRESDRWHNSRYIEPTLLGWRLYWTLSWIGSNIPMLLGFRNGHDYWKELQSDPMGEHMGQNK